MQIFEYIENNLNIKYPVENLSEPSGIIFIDIETTGLSPATAEVYLIGTAVLKDDHFYIRQFFASDPSEEKELLSAFAEYLKSYDTIVTFNGNKFDIPFLEKRSFKCGVDLSFSEKTGVDLYKRIRPYKKLLSLPDLKQKTIEKFLGVRRMDKKSGRELISLYGNYIADKNRVCLDLLLRHNHDDVIGLLALLPILSYPDIINGAIHPERTVKNNYRDFKGQIRTELIIEFTCDTYVPVPVSCGFSDCYLMLRDNRGKIRVAVFTGILRYFYPDHNNYYYLPIEDRAMHKSSSQYVDKDRRQQAKPENCYVRVRSQFLPQWETIVTPVFKYAYNDRTMYFELTSRIKNDPELFKRYAGHLMSMILQEY
ncbi:MAG: ribonuclease H-like domain-containing protein [Lachnospiraceae bacterium]|nr:ribonuclease H-like domain-containing protein [Lachnospiraceae bacterium]